MPELGHLLVGQRIFDRYQVPHEILAGPGTTADQSTTCVSVTVMFCDGISGLAWRIPTEGLQSFEHR